MSAQIRTFLRSSAHKECDTIYENLKINLGAIPASDISSIITRRLNRNISKELYEKGARNFCTVNTDLVNASGLSINLLKQAKMVVGKVGDLAEVTIGGKPVTGDLATTFIVAGRAEWGEEAIAAKDVDFITNEVENLKMAMKEYELGLLAALLVGSSGNTFAAAAAGTLSYADLVKARRYNRVDGFGLETVAVHPDQMEDLLKDSTLIDTALTVGFDATNFKTKMGWTIAEYNALTAAKAYCFGPEFATLVEKVPLKIKHYDASQGGDPRLAKGVIAWEMIDIVVRNSEASCTITNC